MSATAVSYHTSRQARKDAQKRDSRARREERERQAQIDSNIKKLRSTYGIGDDFGEIQKKREALQTSIGDQPETIEETIRRTSYGGRMGRTPTTTFRTRTVANPAIRKSMEELRGLNRQAFEAQETQKNRDNIENYLGDYEDSLKDISILDVQDQYGDAKLQQRRQLAKQGLLGGSVDYQGRRAQLEQYVAGRQAAVAGARAGRQKLESDLTRQRQNLEGQIQSGTQVNPNFREIAGDIRSGLDTASASIGPTTAAGLFTVAGNAVAEDQLARGRRRLRTDKDSPGSGTIT